jgi:hypothetical protein
MVIYGQFGLVGALELVLDLTVLDEGEGRHSSDVVVLGNFLTKAEGEREAGLRKDVETKIHPYNFLRPGLTGCASTSTE